MGRHLKGCGLAGRARSGAAAPAKLAERSFHLFVDVRYAPDYWLHLAAPADESLDSVDYFLRKIWVECCGHLSAFTIEGVHYVSQGADELEASGMDAQLGRVLRPGIVFKYKYDFGTPTELGLKVVGFWERGTEGGGIELLARNDEPQVACHECGKEIATQICNACQWRGAGAGWLCDQCADRHDCGGETLLPVVNSPRAGVCGYSG